MLAVIATTISAVSIIFAIYLLQRTRKVQGESDCIQLFTDLEERIKMQDQRLADLVIKYELVESKVKSGYLSQSFPLPVITPLAAPQPKRSNEKRTRLGSNSTTKVLTLLKEQEMTAIDVMKALECSREHAARLMKSLAEKGLVSRTTHTRPFKYRITEKGLSLLQ